MNRRGAATLATLAVLLLSAGCRSSSSTSTASNPSPAATVGTAVGTTIGTGTGTGGPKRPATNADPVPSSGCGTNGTPGTSHEQLSAGGKDRTYLLTVPDNYAASTPAPLVVDLHGLGANGTIEAAYSKLGEKGAARGVITITPDALNKMWTIPPLPGNDDVGFVNAAMDHVEATLCVDRNREYVAGISNGAAFVGGFSCQAADRLAAFSMIAGPNAYRPCTDKPPVAFVGFHGTDDPLVPYAGGRLFQGTDPNGFGGDGPRVGGLLSLKPTEEALAGWARRNGCSSGPATSTVSAHVSLIGFTDCTKGADARLYRIDGGGHTWPGAKAIPGDPLGATTAEIDASTIILDFFAAHAR